MLGAVESIMICTQCFCKHDREVWCVTYGTMSVLARLSAEPWTVTRELTFVTSPRALPSLRK
jgi:hypothetical protein